MRTRSDLTGKKFGRWTALEYVGLVRGARRWRCACECGNTKEVNTKELLQGRTNSCGCLAAELSSKRRFVHGLSNSKIHRIWSHILTRCLNSNNKDYPRYGGRGITICERWMNFENFLEDMGIPPTDLHSIDRERVNGNYEPGNCRWATAKEQARNRRNSLIVSHNGISVTAAEWDESLGFFRGTVAKRIRKGWSISEAIETPINKCLSRPQSRKSPRDIKIVRGELVPDSSVQRDRDCGKDGKS
jgi:hypothetical protein